LHGPQLDECTNAQNKAKSVTFSAVLERCKAAKAASSSSRDQDVSGDFSDDDEHLDLAMMQRQEKLEAAVTRAHNCLLTGQKLNTQIMLMLKGWKATTF
jgi:hypothetical protein